MIRSRAGLDDADAFAAFRCWDGDPALVWAEEVENYIRGALPWQFTNVTLAFRDDGDLVAVSSFFPSVVGLPLVEPIDHQSWHLDVVAVELSRQRRGLSGDLLEQTFAEMRREDPERILVTGYVHQANTASLAACARVGLTPLAPRDNDYWILLGEVSD